MSIQQSFNQGLMGTTFLLQQMPGFKQAQEVAGDVSRLKKEGKILKETRNTINKRAGAEAEAANAVLTKQSQEFLAGFSNSADPRLRTKAAIATSRLTKGTYDKRISEALQNPTTQSASVLREQVDEVIADRFDMIEMNRKRALDSIRNLRGELSHRQFKKLNYKTNKKYDEQIEEERNAQYDPDEQ